MKREMFQALVEDQALVSLVGRIASSDKPCIFFSTPLSQDSFPAVAFFEKAGSDAIFADDICIARTVCMQVDIWAEGSLSDVYDRVDFVVRSLGYVCDKVCDMPDANINHMQMVYKKFAELN